MMDEVTRAAFERLLKVARGDTGQSRRVANFILAWWNATDHGGFDLADLFAVDRELAADMARVVGFLATRSVAVYPEQYQEDILGIIRAWRPEFWARCSEE